MLGPLVLARARQLLLKLAIYIALFRYSGNKDLFASDARLIFSNCAFYNEDNSEVCKTHQQQCLYASM